MCCVVVCDLETSRIGAPYIYDISSLRVKQNVTFGAPNFRKLKTAKGRHGDNFCIEFHSNPSRNMESTARNMEITGRNTIRLFFVKYDSHWPHLTKHTLARQLLTTVPCTEFHENSINILDADTDNRRKKEFFVCLFTTEKLKNSISPNP